MKCKMIQTEYHYIVNMALSESKYYLKLYPKNVGEKLHENIQGFIKVTYTALFEAGYNENDFKKLDEKIKVYIKKYNKDLESKSEIVNKNKFL